MNYANNSLKTRQQLPRPTARMSSQHVQVAQLLQRDRAAEWVSFGQTWTTGTGIQYPANRSIFNHCDVIGQQSCRIRRKRQNKGYYAVQGHYSGQIFLLFCQNACIWQTDRRTDGRTDGHLSHRSSALAFHAARKNLVRFSRSGIRFVTRQVSNHIIIDANSYSVKLEQCRSLTIFKHR